MRVDDFIERFGADVVWKKLAAEQPNYDELRGEWAGNPVFEEVRIKAVLRPLSAEERATVAGLETEEAIRLLTAAPVQEGDYVEVGGKTYKVIRVDLIYEGGRVAYRRVTCSAGAV